MIKPAHVVVVKVLSSERKYGQGIVELQLEVSRQVMGEEELPKKLTVTYSTELWSALTTFETSPGELLLLILHKRPGKKEGERTGEKPGAGGERWVVHEGGLMLFESGCCALKVISLDDPALEKHIRRLKWAKAHMFGDENYEDPLSREEVPFWEGGKVDPLETWKDPDEEKKAREAEPPSSAKDSKADAKSPGTSK